MTVWLGEGGRHRRGQGHKSFGHNKACTLLYWDRPGLSPGGAHLDSHLDSGDGNPCCSPGSQPKEMKAPYTVEGFSRLCDRGLGIVVL